MNTQQTEQKEIDLIEKRVAPMLFSSLSKDLGPGRRE